MDDAKRNAEDGAEIRCVKKKKEAQNYGTRCEERKKANLFLETVLTIAFSIFEHFDEALSRGDTIGQLHR